MTTKASLLYSLAINAFFLLLCLLFGELIFGAIDDFFMARILEGVYGNGYNIHLTFVNALYGCLLLPLYHLFPKVGWYYVVEMFAMFLSLTVIDFVLLKKLGKTWGLLTATLVSAALASDYYLVLQFTQCAEALSAAGVLLLWIGLETKSVDESKKIRNGYLILGVLLLVWGTMMRYDAFFMGIPFFILIFLLIFFEHKMSRKKLILCTLAIFILVIGSRAFDRSLYTDSEYSPYRAFQGPRAALVDLENYDSQAIYDEMEETGLLGSDFARIKNWSFYDNKVFSLDNVSIIMQLVQKYKGGVNIYSIPENLYYALQKSGTTPIFLLWLFGGMLAFISEKKNVWYVWLTFFFVMVACAYLLYLGRLVYRVESGLWLYSTVLLITRIKQLPLIPFRPVAAIIFVIMVANVFIYAKSDYMVRGPNHAEKVRMSSEMDTVDYVSMFDYLDHLNDSSLVLFPHSEYMNMSFHREPPYLAAAQGSWKKFVPMGFWTPHFPDIEKHINSVGVSNPFEDVVKKNVYVINDARLGPYLKQHYYEEVVLDSVKSFNGMTLYKYSLPGEESAK